MQKYWFHPSSNSKNIILVQQTCAEPETLNSFGSPLVSECLLPTLNRFQGYPDHVHGLGDARTQHAALTADRASFTIISAAVLQSPVFPIW